MPYSLNNFVYYRAAVFGKIPKVLFFVYDLYFNAPKLIKPAKREKKIYLLITLINSIWARSGHNDLTGHMRVTQHNVREGDDGLTLLGCAFNLARGTPSPFLLEKFPIFRPQPCPYQIQKK